MAYTIKRTDNNDEYQFELIQRLRDNLQQQNTPLPIPGNQPADSLIFTLQAQTREIQASWIIHNDGTDRSNGTAPQDGTFTDTSGNGTEDVVTVQEQKQWLQDYIFNGNLGVQYHISGDAFDESSGVKCVVRNFTVEIVNNRPLTYRADLRLNVGTA